MISKLDEVVQDATGIDAIHPKHPDKGIRFCPKRVMMLLRYPLVGVNVPLNVASASTTINEVPGEETVNEAGLLIVTSMPALPSEVPDPITTTMKELDDTVHDEAATPEEGIEPTLAVHV